MKEHNILLTESASKGKPLDFYPRPSLVRDDSNNYLNLNGKWNLEIIKGDFNSFNYSNDLSFSKQIIVPYPVESVLSGLEYNLKDDELLIYQKKFRYDFNKDRTILHIDASDNFTKVFLNGEFVGENIGGYLPIIIDVTKYIKKQNELVVVVSDPLDQNYPYGKQKKENGGIWYTKTSGIWKTVWLESVPNDYIEKVRIFNDIDKRLLKIDFFKKDLCNLKIYYKDKLIKDIKSYKSNDLIEFDEIKLWSPEEPNLYDVIIEYKEDIIKTYFGFRKISIVEEDGHKVFALNNKPYFMHGLLDQGYYPDGILTPSSLRIMEKDLKIIKEYGFNTLRKHIKVEPEMWYYLCDKYGIIVWQDFVNSFKYSFFFDSVLPIIGIKGFSPKITFYKKEYKDFYINHSKRIIDYLYNHPSIVLWTIFNEGWGQFETKKVYNIMKECDKTRIFDSASGWYSTHRGREFESKHIYFKPIVIRKHYKIPLVISEFGGYAYRVDDHSYYNKSFGYREYDSIDSLNDAIYKLYHDEIYGNIKKGVCASIYTQVSDVEEELNGIMTYDRKVIKLKKEVALKIRDFLKF